MIRLTFILFLFHFALNCPAQETQTHKANKSLYSEALRLYNLKLYSGALAAFDTCIAHKYKVDTSYFKSGLIMIDNGRPDEGIRRLEEALVVNPDYFEACYNLGAIYFDKNQYTKSISFYQRAAQLNPKDDNSFYGLAASQLVIGQVMGAELNCNAALKLNPANDQAKKLLEAIKRRKGHRN